MSDKVVVREFPGGCCAKECTCVSCRLLIEDGRCQRASVVPSKHTRCKCINVLMYVCIYVGMYDIRLMYAIAYIAVSTRTLDGHGSQSDRIEAYC